MDIFLTLLDIAAIKILLTIMVVLLVQYFSRQFIGQIVRRAVRSHKYADEQEEKQREQTLTAVFSTATAVIAWVIGTIVILGWLNVNLGALMTGAGLLGIVIGFGAQTTVKDFLSGIFIILENQFRIGDIITVKEICGTVEDITLRITKVRDFDGTLHFVPNGEISVVSNFTFGFARVNMNIRVSYGSDVKRVEEVINKVGKELTEDSEWRKHILEPIAFMWVDSFDDSAVTVKSIGTVMPGMQWDVAGEFRRRIKVAFKENDIEIPYQQFVVHNA